MNHKLRHILLIDDDHLVRQRIKYDLRHIDLMQITEVDTVAKACSLIFEKRYDLIIVDLRLPDGTGQHFIEQARENDLQINTPIIVLSSDVSDEAVIECLKLGANDYLVKPWKKEVLTARITSQIERHVNLRALRESQAELNAILSEQTEIIVRFKPNLRLIYANISAIDFLAVNAQDIDHKSFLDFFPESTHSNHTAQLHALTREQPTGMFESLLKRTDGHSCWLRWTIQAKYEADLLVAYQAVGVDITEIKEAEFKLRKAQRLLSEAQCVANLAGWEFDIQTRCFQWTDQIRNLLEMQQTPPETLDDFVQLVCDPQCNQFRRAIEHACTEGSAFDMELRLVLKNNREIWVRAIGQPELHNLDVVTIWGAFQDITEKKLTEIQRETMRERLEYEATHDQLTELYNRRFIFEQLEKQFAAAQRYQHPMCLCLCDVDHFKKINDQWGHVTGDRALRHIARMLTKSVRGSDFVARYGGEEFAILFPMTTLSGAAICIRRALESIRESPLNSDTNDAIHLSATFGLAQYVPSLDQDMDQFISRVDAALYEGKNQGRDRYILSQTPIEKKNTNS